MRFTSRPGTTMVLARFIPAVNFCTLGSAMAAATMVSLPASAGTVMLALTLPLIYTAIWIVAETVLLSS